MAFVGDLWTVWQWVAGGGVPGLTATDGCGLPLSQDWSSWILKLCCVVGRSKYSLQSVMFAFRRTQLWSWTVRFPSCHNGIALHAGFVKAFQRPQTGKCVDAQVFPGWSVLDRSVEHAAASRRPIHHVTDRVEDYGYRVTAEFMPYGSGMHCFP